MTQIEGIFTAIVTPHDPSGTGINEKLFRQLIERQIEGGITGIVVAGSTGEGQTLSPSEWEKANEIALSYRGKLLVIGACGSSGTEQTIEKFRQLAKLKMDAVLISTPSYNKPPQRGLIEHYRRVCAAVPETPVIVYNIPGRTSVNILPQTMDEIWKISNVVSLKESSGNWEQVLELRRRLPKGKTLLSGEDSMTLACLAHGAHGLVSVVSNLFPKALMQLWTEWKKGNSQKATEIQLQLQEIIPLMMIEPNPIPVKWGLEYLLKAKMPPRLPLVPLDEALHSKLQPVLDHLTKLGFV